MGKIFDAHNEGKLIPLWPGMVHVYVGLTMLALVVVRMIVRWKFGVPVAPTTPYGWMETASFWTHRLLYVLMLAVPIAGAIAWYRGIETVANIHVYAMNTLLWLAGLHAAAALYHHFVLKDGLLKRMWFKRQTIT